jgi:hypothetical protein
MDQESPPRGATSMSPERTEVHGGVRSERLVGNEPGRGPFRHELFMPDRPSIKRVIEYLKPELGDSKADVAAHVQRDRQNRFEVDPSFHSA